MGLLDRSAILGAEDLKHEDVPVPQWGGSVRVRVMTGTERDEFRTTIAALGGSLPVGKFSAVLLAATCVDASGARLFTMEDIEALHAKSATSLDAPATAAVRLNGLGVEAVGDAAKNSASGQSDDSGSDSQGTSAKP
jgi:hypothetical protein